MIEANKLLGVHLDFWCAVSDWGGTFAYDCNTVEDFQNARWIGGKWSPSTDPNQAMEIIQREKISVIYVKGMYDEDESWRANVSGSDNSGYVYGPTPLVAAMRAYVIAKLGTTFNEDLK